MHAHIGVFSQSHAARFRRRAARETASLLRASSAVRASADAPHAGKRVLILGGTGRVGSLTAAELLRAEPGLDVVLAGRREESYRRVVEARPELAAARFLRCDIDSDTDLAAALQGMDLVVHTAGCAACWLSQVLLLCSSRTPAFRPAPCLMILCRMLPLVSTGCLDTPLLCAASLPSDLEACLQHMWHTPSFDVERPQGS